MNAAEASADAIVKQKPVFIAHHAVARLAQQQVRKMIDINPLEKLRGVRADNVDFPQSADIDDSSAGPDQLHFGRRIRVTFRALPQPGIEPLNAGLLVPMMQRRSANRMP